MPVAVTCSGLAAPVVRTEVALAPDADGMATVLGSFVAEGMAFALQPDGTVMLVAISADAGEAGSTVAIPSSVPLDGVRYRVTAIGPHALSLCEAAELAIPASVSSIDEDALWPSSVQRVEVDAASESYASHDGVLYDASLSRLLSIPGGRQGTVRVASSAEGVESGAFSHSALVDVLEADAGGAAFASWDGLLYDAAGEALLRVPAGATRAVIREGCTSVAAGALEGCAALESIAAPASVASVSMSAIEALPLVGPPVAALADDSGQVSGLVALMASDDGIASVDPSSVVVSLPEEADGTPWEALGFSIEREGATGSPLGSEEEPEVAAAAQAATSYEAATCTLTVYSGSYGGSISTTEGTSGNPLTITGVTDYSVYGPTSAGRGTLQYHKNGVLHTATASRSGVTLAGWQVHGMCYVTDGLSMGGTAAGGNTTISAKWSDFTYRVTYNANGGTITHWDSWIYHPGEVIAFTSPSRTGYTFAGWYTNSSLSGNPVGTVTTTANGSLTLWAKWTPIQYSVTWNLNGGSWPSSFSPPASYTIETAYTWNTTYANPTRAGYAFLGWTGSNGTTPDPTLNSIGGGTIGDLSYSANWSCRSYSISYVLDGGSISGQKTSYDIETASFNLVNPTRDNYTFKGWTVSGAQGTGTSSSGTTTTVRKGTYGNLTATANWAANVYAITMDLQGGTSPLGETKYWQEYGVRNWVNEARTEGYGVTLKSRPVRDGYAFGGFYTGVDGAGTQVMDASTTLPSTTYFTANATIYAKWTANTITLAWDGNGGSSVEATSATYSASAKVPMPTSSPTRPGYEFAGWFTAASGGTQVTASTSLPTADARYYAHWTLLTYGIAYELNGGSVSGNPTSYDVTTATFALKNPTRVGYAFAGWSGTDLSGEGNLSVTVAQGSTGNRSYEAHWLPVLEVVVPLRVEAQVDLFGIEEQKPAQGYVESRCGEPVVVASVRMEPLPGAQELFGADSASDVGLEASVSVGGAEARAFSFSLGAPATYADAALSSVLRMGAYGERVPISYRFSIPDELLPTLDETTSSVCSLAYTVALAS